MESSTKKNVSDSGSESQSGLGIYIGKCRKDDKDLYACPGGPFGDKPGWWKACFLLYVGTVEVKCFEGMDHQNGTSTTEMTTTNTTSKVMGKFFNLYLWFPLV